MRRLLLLLPALLAGCSATASPDGREEAPVTELGANFDPDAAGTVRGQVVWSGDVPDVPPLRVWALPFDPPGIGPSRPNPYAPAVDPATHGVRDVRVSLRGVDPRRSRPWDLPPVRVALRDFRIDVCQGDGRGRVGFVRRGEAVEVVSEQAVSHTMRADGVEFWTLAFPDPGRPLSRRLSRTGVVELSSGSGYFWTRAELLVTEHPYVAATDAEGRFTLTRVPPGRYELVCRLPDWRVRRQERDPETMRAVRLVFGPPAELVTPVTVRAGETCSVTVPFGEGAFPR